MFRLSGWHSNSATPTATTAVKVGAVLPPPPNWGAYLCNWPHGRKPTHKHSRPQGGPKGELSLRPNLTDTKQTRQQLLLLLHRQSSSRAAVAATSSTSSGANEDSFFFAGF
ncbi:unnamed protein product [Amoebophrya sp. A25]|nr:unnamed protein product [Amoebophrya sp. A25]|eukprot:GSA25T00027384001.1